MQFIVSVLYSKNSVLACGQKYLDIKLCANFIYYSKNTRIVRQENIKLLEKETDSSMIAYFSVTA